MPVPPPARPLVLRLYAVISLTGAMAFILALACGAWFYLVRLQAVPPGATPWTAAQAVTFNFALFSAFALHHSVFARPPVKRWLLAMVAPELERTSFVWIASALFIAMCLAWRPAAGVVWELRGGMQVLGYGTQLAGLWFTFTGARMIDVFELAGVRWVVRGPEALDDPGDLTERGPYTLVRHPIYLGWVLLTFGAPEMTLGRLTFAFISFVYLVVAVPLEERALLRRHGESYRQYQSRVRWRMLPGMY